MSVTQPEFRVGDTRISFLFDRAHGVIHKLPGVVAAQRGLLSSVHHHNKPGGEPDLVINEFVTSVLRHEESDLTDGRFKKFSDTNFTLKNDVCINYLALTSEMLDWLSENTLCRWGVRNIHHHNADRSETDKREIVRKTYLSFERAKDAIHFKLRWVG